MNAIPPIIHANTGVITSSLSVIVNNAANPIVANPYMTAIPMITTTITTTHRPGHALPMCLLQ